MDYLRDTIVNYPKIDTTLPLGHTTKWGNFKIIVERNEFVANAPFGSDIISYCFYGLPLYRTNLLNKKLSCSEDMDDRPIGIIFRPTLLERCNRFYPFDTGGFNSNLYREYFPPDFELNHVEVPITMNSHPSQYISLMFGSNQKYVYGEPRHNKPQNQSEVVDALIEFFNDGGAANYDERSRAIEVHIPNNIEFKSNVEMIIVPDAQYDRNERILKKYLKGIKIKKYSALKRYGIKEDCGKIMEIACQYYKKKYFKG